MMEIEHITDPFDPDPCQAVITSSGNGIRALADSTDKRDFLLFVVGPQSARLAESLGFTNLKVAAGSGKALVGFIHRTIKPTDKPLVYFRSDVVQVPIGRELKKSGFRTIPRLAYETKPTKTFPDNVLEEFAKPTPPEVAVFMSIRTYRLFSNAVEKCGLGDKTKSMTAIAISNAVADFVRERHWKNVITAKETSAASIVDSIAALKTAADAGS